MLLDEKDETKKKKQQRYHNYMVPCKAQQRLQGPSNRDAIPTQRNSDNNEPEKLMW